jgi:hypothetical protein
MSRCTLTRMRSTCIVRLLLWSLLAVVTPSEALLSSKAQLRRPVPVSVGRRPPFIAPSCRLAIPPSEDGDGWGDDESSSSDRENALRELDRLRQPKGSQPSSQRGITGNSEPDYFIPMFTLVAIAGFAGAYAYEFAGLYSRGELYLPWEQN